MTLKEWAGCLCTEDEQDRGSCCIVSEACCGALIRKGTIPPFTCTEHHCGCEHGNCFEMYSVVLVDGTHAYICEGVEDYLIDKGISYQHV
jgi:hypothetical protein